MHSFMINRHYGKEMLPQRMFCYVGRNFQLPVPIPAASGSHIPSGQFIIMLLIQGLEEKAVADM